MSLKVSEYVPGAMLVDAYVPSAAVVALETPQPLQVTVTPWSGLEFEPVTVPLKPPSCVRAMFSRS